MTDDIRTRIAAAICTDNPFGWTAYMCEEAADAVIAQLEADYILVPKGHTIARIRSAEKLGLTGDGR